MKNSAGLEVLISKWSKSHRGLATKDTKVTKNGNGA